MTTSFVYTAVFTFMMASGQPIEADDASYSNYDRCMIESEASARQMAREWAWEEERTGLKGFYRGVEVRCEKRPAKAQKKAVRHGK